MRRWGLLVLLGFFSAGCQAKPMFTVPPAVPPKLSAININSITVLSRYELLDRDLFRQNDFRLIGPVRDDPEAKESASIFLDAFVAELKERTPVPVYAGKDLANLDVLNLKVDLVYVPARVSPYTPHFIFIVAEGSWGHEKQFVMKLGIARSIIRNKKSAVGSLASMAAEGLVEKLESAN